MGIRDEKNYALTMKDLGLIVLIILIYGLVSFINLGSFTNPQTFWNTQQQGNTVIIALDQETSISKIRHFSGARFGDYKLSISSDGINYKEVATLEEPKVFAWFDTDFPYTFKYLSIQAEETDSMMGEICLYDTNGNPVPLIAVTEAANAIIDEGDVVPEEISYLNSTYFDEIYHARTAYEYIHGMDIYEWTHPPLGKLIMSIPIRLLGMNPFAYRLMGNIAGILMLAVIYIFAKRLFGKTKYAFLAALLFAVDGMHFVQTRIATVDSYLVLFMMLSFLFMYQYVRCSTKGSLCSKLVNLCFSGIFLGAAIATKWSGAYMAIGLAIIFFVNLYSRLKESGYYNNFKKQVPIIIGSCIGFFIIIPIGIYLASYIPFFLRPENTSLKDLWDLQLRMYHYHADLEATHPFTSPWYLWPLDIKPVWYYKGDVKDGFIASIAVFGNPIIWWSGILGMIYCFKEAIVEREKEYAFLSIGILSVYLPYVLISRIMFLYHYFPVVPLMILALVGFLKVLDEKVKKFHIIRWFCVIAILAFIFFYPIYAGATIPRWYASLTQWIPKWWHFFN